MYERWPKNFWIHYEMDCTTVNTTLRMEEYGGEHEFDWVLLKPAPRAGNSDDSTGEGSGVAAWLVRAIVSFCVEFCNFIPRAARRGGFSVLSFATLYRASNNGCPV